MALPTNKQVTGIIKYITELDSNKIASIISSINVKTAVENKQLTIDAVYLNWISFLTNTLKSNKENPEVDARIEAKKYFDIFVQNLAKITKDWFIADAINKGITKIVVTDDLLIKEFGENTTIFHISESDRKKDPMIIASYILVYDYYNIIHTLAKYNL